MITIQSGPPIAPHMASWNLADNGGFLQRPNLVGNPNTSGTITSRLNNYLNMAAFTQFLRRSPSEARRVS